MKFEWVNYCYSGDRAKFEKGTPSPSSPLLFQPPFWREAWLHCKHRDETFPKFGTKIEISNVEIIFSTEPLKLVLKHQHIMRIKLYTARNLYSDKKFSHEDSHTALWEHGCKNCFENMRRIIQCFWQMLLSVFCSSCGCAACAACSDSEALLLRRYRLKNRWICEYADVILFHGIASRESALRAFRFHIRH